MAKVKLTITEGNCRCGYCKAGDEILVENLCPPLCHELLYAAYPYVFALRNGDTLDQDKEKARCFDVQCPDGGRVKAHGEGVEE